MLLFIFLLTWLFSTLIGAQRVVWITALEDWEMIHQGVGTVSGGLEKWGSSPGSWGHPQSPGGGGDSPVVSRKATPFSFLSSPRPDAGERKSFMGDMGACNLQLKSLEKPWGSLRSGLGLSEGQSHWPYEKADSSPDTPVSLG